MQRQLAALQAKFELPDLDFVLTVADGCPQLNLPRQSHDGNTARCSDLVIAASFLRLAKD